MSGLRLVLETNVLIIGAGPAGCACAIQLLRQGKRVVIIDKAIFPRQAPGETLHPGIEPLFRCLGVMKEASKVTFTRHNGVNTVVNDQTVFTPYSETESWKGFQLSRPNFDRMLVEEAKRLGAIVYFQESPRGLVKDRNGNITEVICTNLDVRPSFVVDSTGRRRWMAKPLSLQYENLSPRLLAWYGYVECKNSDFFQIPQFVWNKKGWTWLAKVREGLVSWVCLDVIEPNKRRIDWLPEQLRDSQALDKTKGADVTWSISDRLSENNWFLAGDAAFVLDPASSHGILKAIMSGMMVSHLIGQYSTFERSLIHRYYDDWARNLFSSDCKKLRKLYESSIDGIKDYWK